MTNFVNINQAMRLLGVSRTTIYRWRKQGWIKSYRPSPASRMIFFDLDELKAQFSPHESKSPPGH